MAKYAGVTAWQVREVWRAADLKPHRLKSFKISNDPKFADKVIDVVGLYLDPPANAMVLSVDEKSQIQALDRTQPMLQLRPGQIERRTHDYKRNGTATLYAAFDIATGEVLGRVTRRHRAKEFLAFLQQIERSTPRELDLHLILDNSSTHKTAKVQEWLGQHPRFKLHFTPTSASWLNAVEGWFSRLERRCIHRGVFRSVKDLRNEIHRFIREHNDHAAKPFVWTKSAETILASVERARAAHSCSSCGSI
jgi:transposase